MARFDHLFGQGGGGGGVLIDPLGIQFNYTSFPENMLAVCGYNDTGITCKFHGL